MSANDSHRIHSNSGKICQLLDVGVPQIVNTAGHTESWATALSLAANLRSLLTQTALASEKDVVVLALRQLQLMA